MAGTRPDGYSAMQIMLHWSVATLVVFQFFVNDGIAEAWRGFARGETVDEGLLAAANVHVIIGITILALALWRIALMLPRRAPTPRPGSALYARSPAPPSSPTHTSPPFPTHQRRSSRCRC